uniref:Si:ch1073-349o24.2 n=1 Tax=Stegastes partitus TaxID=144197 RepID=A0A3B5BNL6_9TELE
MLTALYRPTQPIAHHRRVACLILHREPVFLDLIGTCHSEHQKPAILKPEHLVLYKLHSPDALTAMQQDQNGHLDQQGLNQRPDSAAVMSTMDPSSLPSSSSSQHVSVVPSELLFNHKTTSWLSTSCASSQSVSITNNTRGKLGLVWTVSRDSPFSVSPSLCDLAPLKSTSFRVTYEPKQLNSLHGAELECFAYSKVVLYIIRGCCGSNTILFSLGFSSPELAPHFLSGPQLNPRWDRILVCRAELRFDPAEGLPNPHPQNSSVRRESQTGL